MRYNLFEFISDFLLTQGLIIECQFFSYVKISEKKRREVSTHPLSIFSAGRHVRGNFCFALQTEQKEKTLREERE